MPKRKVLTAPKTRKELRIGNYLPLAKKIAGLLSRKHPYIDRDEILSQCTLALTDAERRWDPQKGSFATIAAYWMRGRAGEVVQKARREARNFPRAPLTHTFEDGGDDYIPDDAPSPFDVLADKESAEHALQTVRALLPQLTERQRFVIQARHLRPEPLSLGAIAKELGVSGERARQIHADAMSRMRGLLAGEAPSTPPPDRRWRAPEARKAGRPKPPVRPARVGKARPPGRPPGTPSPPRGEVDAAVVAAAVAAVRAAGVAKLLPALKLALALPAGLSTYEARALRDRLFPGRADPQFKQQMYPGLVREQHPTRGGVFRLPAVREREAA
jgi:RNA polymerase sigma factor (sigma-70 family)